MDTFEDAPQYPASDSLILLEDAMEDQRSGIMSLLRFLYRVVNIATLRGRGGLFYLI